MSRYQRVEADRLSCVHRPNAAIEPIFPPLMGAIVENVEVPPSPMTDTTRMSVQRGKRDGPPTGARGAA